MLASPLPLQARVARCKRNAATSRVRGENVHAPLRVVSPALRVAVDRGGVEHLLGIAELEPDRPGAGLEERHRAVKTRPPSGVAGACAGLLDLDQDCILIAIDAHF